MARIPDTELERLKTDIDVQQLVQQSGVELKKAGKDWLGRCPFHADDTSSLVVTPAKNLWHCFGCSAAGGPIDWVMRMQGVSFRHAVELLKAGPSSAAEAGDAPKRSRTRPLPPPVALDADEQTLLGQVIDYYHQTLLQAPEALAYLQARGIGDPEAVARFRLGYANRTLGLRLPERNRVAGNELRTKLQRIGIYRDSGHEHLTGSLVIPVFDAAGNVVEVYGRKLLDNLRPGTPKHLYLPGPHAGVWNLDGVQGSEEVIVCESLIDALTFWCAGLRHVTTAYGVEGVTDELRALLASPIDGRPRRVLIAFDRDDAGERGAAKLAEALMAQGVDCYRVQFPKGLDANEYARKVQPAAKSLPLLVRQAAWLGAGTPPARLPGEQVAIEVEAAAPVPMPELPSSAAAPAVPASPPAPSAPPTPELPVQVKDDEVVLALGERRWRVRGLAKNLAFETMKVNLLVSCGDAYYVDTVDLYSARHRAHYLAAAAKELAVRDEVLKTDIGRILLKLEALQEERIKAATKTEPQVPELSEAEELAALDLLKSPDLLQRILADFEACGVVGERVNKLMGYLAATSRKLDRPLAVVIQSSSAAGKSSLMDAVLAFVPEEERVQFSALTGQALFYMGETNLQHKVLAISEEEGAHRAAYALKLLQSEGELTIASTGTDAAGNLVTQQYKVCGPVMLFLTTTAIDIDEELMNRCLVLSVDEGREQTAAIHRQQRLGRTLDGLIAKQHKREVLALHRNAQRLLRPLAVVNPYADRLTFLDDRTRTRRDHGKYLALMDVLALLHQHQRPVRTASVGGQVIEYVEVTLADIEQANALAHEVLGRSLDELPPQTRKLLAIVQHLVQAKAVEQSIEPRAVRFSRAEVRRAAGASDTQCRLHLERLTAMEYLLVHRGMRGQSFEYELLFDGSADEHRPRLAGLIDVGALQLEALEAGAEAATTTASSRGAGVEFAGSTRPQRALVAGASRPGSSLATPALARLPAEPLDDEPPARPPHLNGAAPSYLQTGEVQ
ncbi:DNA primase catalytic core [Inhella inkyongensis]|uniref:DNA primase catalytic core n=1 Tax=Inhella inkyongensis TaxID=392593 RepID=A0A840SAA9_9BURK|nr:CHC2 zinc finger domain-containing protein [Inhella inkyongensis]MBB5206468.1 DNA primase catalytic core [Inhella inkyongensis]